jgi:hypothetical protein
LAELDHRRTLLLEAERDVGRVPGVVGDHTAGRRSSVERLVSLLPGRNGCREDS